MKKPAKTEKVNWRAHLTARESFFMKQADEVSRRAAEAQAEWSHRFGTEYPKIKARAIERAKTAAGAK